MFWMGKNCPVRKKIMTNGNLGMIHSFIKDSDVEVMGSFKNMNKTSNTQVEVSLSDEKKYAIANVTIYD